MLIHAQGSNRGNAPVKLYLTDQGSNYILVGDATTRIMLTPEEIRELYKLLDPFISRLGGKPSPCLHPKDPPSQRATEGLTEEIP
jgi:hypothetical protein